MARVRGADTEYDAFVRCRTYSHAWDEYYPIDLEAPWYGWRLSLRCTRCGTERHDNLDFKGEIMGRRYIYAQGYQTRGQDKPTKQVFRAELFSRLRDKLVEVNAIGQDEKVTPLRAARKRKSA